VPHNRPRMYSAYPYLYTTGNRNPHEYKLTNKISILIVNVLMILLCMIVLYTIYHICMEIGNTQFNSDGKVLFKNELVQVQFKTLNVN